MQLKMSTRLLTNMTKVTKDVRNYVMRLVRQRVGKSRYMLEVYVKQRLLEELLNSSTYRDAMDGQLRHELGLANPQSQFFPIIERLVNSIQVSVPKVSTGSVQIVLRGVPTDYSDILGMPEASFVTENGDVIEWLKWLLIDQDLIAEYNIKFGSFANSRTGGAVMIKTRRGWQLQGEHAGDSSDNFVTRALTSIYPDIESYVNTNIRRVLTNG